MTNSNQCCQENQVKHGFTIIELLIAVSLSTIVMAAAIALFVVSHRTYLSSGQQSVLQQKARAALDLIASDLQQAGLGLPAPRTARAGEVDMVFSVLTVNNINQPDVLQFRASLGGAMIFGQNDSRFLSNTTGGSGTWLFVADPVDTVNPFDFFENGSQVKVLNRDRQNSGEIDEALYATINTDPALNAEGNPVFGLDFAPGGADPSIYDVVQSSPGMILVERPLYVTYKVIGSTLYRCTSFTSTDCTDTGSAPPSSTDPQGTIPVLDGVDDLQYSFYIPNSGSGLYEWRPAAGETGFALTRAMRLTITAVRIELLLESRSPDPLLSAEPEFSSQRFYLGDSKYDVSADELNGTDGTPRIKARTQVSMVVRLPNMLIGQSWPSDT